MTEKIKPLKLNNKGLSLVELLVAIAISVIVAGSIASLITFAIRMYRNESVNTSMQYELQTNLNMIMDEIMGAQTMIIAQNSGVGVADTDKGPYTDYALFGNFNAEFEHEGGSVGKGFKGVIFVSSSAGTDHKFKLYMNRIAKETTIADTLADRKAFAEGEKTAVLAAPEKYLLGENLTRFVIIPDPDNISFKDDTKAESGHSFTNPVSVKVELNFEDKGWAGKEINKHVNDSTYLRNKVTDNIYVNPGSGFVTYNLKKKDD